MKTRFCLLTMLLFSVVLPCPADQSAARAYVKEAARMAAKENKLLVIEFWSPYCLPCIGLKRDIFENKIHAQFVLQHFYLTKVSPADSIYQSLWKYFHLDYESSVVYLDHNGKELERTVGYNGDRDTYLNVMNDIAFGKNLYKDVLAQYRRDSSSALNCCRLARKYYSRYELEKAEQLYSKVLVSDSTNTHGLRAECLFKIAEIAFTRTGQLTKMRVFVDESPMNPFAPKAYVYLINDYLNKNDMPGCLAICETAYVRYPDSWEVLNKYAWALCSFKVQREYPKALAMVQRSISLNPSRAATYSTEAWIHFEGGDKQKAIQLLKKAIEIFPDRSFVRDLETFETR